MSALIRVHATGAVESHTLCLALAMVARKEATLLDGSYHATKARKARKAAEQESKRK
jgi:hypothetical protein